MSNDDPIEYIGNDKTSRANPIPSKNKPVVTALVEKLAQSVEPPVVCVAPGATTANYPLNIFDQFGGISETLSDEEIAKCSPAQLAVLFPLLEAWSDTKAEDGICANVEADQRKAATALDKARKALEVATPKWTAHDEWRKTVARLPTPEPSEAVVRKINAAKAVVEAAETYLAVCVAAVHPAQMKRQARRAGFAKRLKEWILLDARPRTVGDLVKERAATETKIKMANVATGLHPDYVEGSASTVGPSFLDQFKAGQGKGHSINRGHNANRMRGAQLKVPSEL